MYRLKKIRDNGLILVVGCGGTGGFVAEGLCRLLIGTKYHIYLVDHDRVENRNLGRQNFTREDLGKFKAEVLARRLSDKFNRQIDYLVSPIEQLQVNDRGDLNIGCVDNPGARDRLQYASRYTIGGYYSYSKAGYEQSWYIDAGNGEYNGQVLIGNAFLNELHWSFYPESGICEKLPLPQIQQPALLAPQTKPVHDCAEAVQREEQSPVINQAMAALVLQFVSFLLKGELAWMGAYLDLKAGTLSTVPADPDVVYRLTGAPGLIYKPKKEKVRVRVNG